MLTEAGLAPALATLADDAPAARRARRRADGAATPRGGRAAAYVAVAEAVDDAAGAAARLARVDAARDDGRLVVDGRGRRRGRATPLVHLADRVGALGGTLEARRATDVRAEIPCA